MTNSRIARNRAELLAAARTAGRHKSESNRFVYGVDATLIIGMLDEIDALRRALKDAVEVYGRPGGPWNVPSDPGGWLSRAREALGEPAKMTGAMDPKTLRALKASIAHWEQNATAETFGEVRIGVSTCALCALFSRKRCAKCPVRLATGVIGCSRSPYDNASDARSEWEHDPGNPTFAEAFRAAARKEVEFLKSLLPAEDAR